MKISSVNEIISIIVWGWWFSMSSLLSSILSSSFEAVTALTALVHLLMLFRPWSSPLMLTTLALWMKILLIHQYWDQHVIETDSPSAFIISGLFPGKPTKIHIFRMTTCCCTSSSAAWLFINDSWEIERCIPATLILLSARLDAAVFSTPWRRLPLRNV